MAALLLNNCTHVDIKDQVWYGDLGKEGAVAFHTLTQETFDVPKDKWDDMRLGMACTSQEVLADIKADIEKLCSISRRCTYEEHLAIRLFLNNMDKVRRRSGLKPRLFQSQIETSICDKFGGPCESR